MKTGAQKNNPALWERIRVQVLCGDKGGLPGQWSARKAQLATRLYQKAGGGYVGPKQQDNALTRWTKQDWTTKSGLPSLSTGERYLPRAAVAALSPQEYKMTTRAKQQGMARGLQFVPQPKPIQRKTAPFRKNTNPEEDKYVYHATHLGRADSIASRGLELSRGSQFSGGYTAHSKGRIFATNFAGLPYWLSKMEAIAEDQSDFDSEDDIARWTPIALRLYIEPGVQLHPDDLGNRDNRAGEAYFLTCPLPPDYIDVWNGSEWLEIKEADLDRMQDEAIAKAHREETEDSTYYSPVFDLFAPTEP